ncbi:ATP-binding cassette domain-containing protein [Paenibacillus sp. NPDC058071]|uniref:ATP-binding cassette domain-containing protein n=1 Tax=Paenibacillus sp. NPDC058071 TaxID=3346326 RepID=UPI0036DD2AFC
MTRKDWLLTNIAVETTDAENGRPKRLLDGLQAMFPAGTITLLIGRNGSGKSTMLETIAGLRTLAEGEIKLGNMPLWETKGRKKRLNKTVLLQFGLSLQQSEAQWFAQTAQAELLYSLKPYRLGEAEQEERIGRAASAVGLPLELLARDPWALSGGQQRRLALACLLACEPEWLLLDEPAAGLDTSGAAMLRDTLVSHRASGGGAIVVTHDLEELLPIADRVLVLEAGRITEAAPASVWAAAHAGDRSAPQALQLTALLQEKGVRLPQAYSNSGAVILPTPQEIASAIAAHKGAIGAVEGAAGEEETTVRLDGLGPFNAPLDQPNKMEKAALSDYSEKPRRWSDMFDPRTIIVSYLLLATAIMLQNSWFGLAGASVVVPGLLAPVRRLIRPWLPALRAYAVMVAAISVFSGLNIQPIGFDEERMLATLHRFIGFLLAMALGLPILSLMSPLRLQRALEQTFGFLTRVKVPVASIALTVTLLFRFLPLLASEWQRFAAIARARGKAAARPGASLPASMLLPAIVPYLRSLLRMAEQLADALEARGVGKPDAAPTRGFTLRPGRSDGWLVGVSAAAAALLLYLDVLL